MTNKAKKPELSFDDEMNIGELTSIMQTNNLTARKVAELLGVSHISVSRWLNGWRRLSYDTIRKLKRALGEEV